MPITDNIGGVLHTLDTIHDNDGGVLHELATVHSNDDGVLHEIHSAWKPPDTLTWQSLSGGNATVTATNNGYNCTISGRTGNSNGERFDFTLKKPTRFTIKLNNWTGTGAGITNPIILQYYSLDGGSSLALPYSNDSFSVCITEAGSHYIRITTSGEPVTFTVTAEKI